MLARKCSFSPCNCDNGANCCTLSSRPVAAEHGSVSMLGRWQHCTDLFLQTCIPPEPTILSLMQHCWGVDPVEGPAFSVLLPRLRQLPPYSPPSIRPFSHFCLTYVLLPSTVSVTWGRAWVTNQDVTSASIVCNALILPRTRGKAGLSG